MKNVRSKILPTLLTTSVALGALGFAASSGAVGAGFFAALKGTTEIPITSTTGIGSFEATLSDDGSTVSYALSYTNMEGNVLQAHIHFGQGFATGPVVVFLCTNLDPPEGVPTPPACPQTEGSVTGTFTEANVGGGAADNGIAAGEFDELVAAMRAGAAYVNVHSDLHPAGEIRGQVVGGP